VPRYERYDPDALPLDRDMTSEERTWLEEDEQLAEISRYARDAGLGSMTEDELLDFTLQIQ